MKHYIILAFLCFWPIQLCYGSQTPVNYGLAEPALLKAFPGFIIQKNFPLFGNQETDNVLVNISLRNKKAFIPFSKSKTIQLNDSTAVIAFEIFLYTEDKPVNEIITRNLQNYSGNRKLLQLLFYNPKSFSINGKPAGFPIEAESWLCSGDISDITHIVNLEKVHGNSPSYVLCFSKSTNKQYLHVFLFHNGAIKSSKNWLEVSVAKQEMKFGSILQTYRKTVDALQQ